MEITRRNLLGAASVGAAGLVATASTVAVASATAPSGPVTETVFLTGRDADSTVPWDFQVTSGRRGGVWSTIPTPSNWECQGFGSYNYGWNLVPGEIGHYRTSFIPPGSWTARRVFLVFDGSMTDTQVWVNGSSAGPIHQGGFYRFRYDVTALLKLGQPNLLEVTVSKESSDNSVNNAERRGDYWNFGGIFRPVTLQAFPAARIDRVAVDAQASGAFMADVFVAGLTGGGRVVGQIRRLDGSAVGSPISVQVAPGATRATLSTTVSGPRLWTAETPNLYQVDVQLTDAGGASLHGDSERFGFRTVQVRAGDGIYVNGTAVRLKGTNRHTFWPTLGRASSPRIAREDILLIKEMNMNAVRMSHYPPDAYFLDLCDELGLYVLDELGGWQKRYDEGVGAPLVASMVQRDVNHPSILFWDNGNEGGWNTALDDDFALYDPQGRKVLHPQQTFSGIDATHYPTYATLTSKLAGSTIFMPTEFLHGLYDGGAGAGLNDYWSQMLSAPRSAGGFIWSFIDEGLVRDDKGGAIDTSGNLAPDGILGPFRQKEASFATIKDIWSPIQLSNAPYYATRFPVSFDGTVKVVNRFEVTNLSVCSFGWQLLTFAAPGATSSAPTVTAQGSATAPDVVPGSTGSVRLGLPSTWNGADALRLTVTDSTGRVRNDWVWTIKKAVDHANRLVAPAAGTVTATETSDSVSMTSGSTKITISKSTGRLTEVLRGNVAVSLANGPAPSVGEAVLTGLTHSQDGSGHVVQAAYTGGLTSVRWRLDSNGWLQLEYRYSLTGNHDFFGVDLDYPESKVRALTWLGHGPYRVYKNRRRGVNPSVWTKAYNNTATGGVGWQYPEFKGYHANTYWAALSTAEGTITMVAAEENLFLRLFTPAVGATPVNATVAYPRGGISFLDGIPAIGNKFHAATALGPESQSNVAAGDYHRSVYFKFGS